MKIVDHTLFHKTQKGQVPTKHKYGKIYKFETLVYMIIEIDGRPHILTLDHSNPIMSDGGWNTLEDLDKAISYDREVDAELTIKVIQEEK